MTADDKNDEEEEEDEVKNCQCQTCTMYAMFTRLQITNGTCVNHSGNFRP